MRWKQKMIQENWGNPSVEVLRINPKALRELAQQLEQKDLM
jgi:hypothetical protein